MQEVLKLRGKTMTKNCGNCHWQFISTMDRGIGYTTCSFDMILRPSKNDKCYRWQKYVHGPSPEDRVSMANELKEWEGSEEGHENIIKNSGNNHLAIIAAAIIGAVVGFVLGFLV